MCSSMKPGVKTLLIIVKCILIYSWIQFGLNNLCRWSIANTSLLHTSKVCFMDILESYWLCIYLH